MSVCIWYLVGLLPEEQEKSGKPGDLTPEYLCICVFVYLCICVFGLCGAGEEVWPGDLTPVYLCIVYLCTRVFVYLVFGRSGAGGGGEVRAAK